jgi:hypothetical protein
MALSLIPLCSLSICSISRAEIQSLRVKALYKSRKGQTAVIHYRGKDMNVSVDRIHNLPTVITGKAVTVTLRPEEIGLNLQD